LGLLNPALSLGSVILAAKLDRGSVSISVSDVLTFVLTVWVAYKLSAFIRFLLDEDVYPRMGFAQGQSYAMSSLLNYIILAAGFVVGLGIVGADLSKLTILAGAFGVGIGFGLQSVVNNFVSGLILLFERPIRVGDSVQVGSVQGRVRRIGIRASVVSTGQGAEIIVPNARLISEEVTNWTRSDQLRRVDVKVGISYGTAQKKVIELLESVARAHPHVLANPPPVALFMGYGDSSIDFELRAWTEYANSAQVQSGLTAAIYDAVYAAGMSFPFPQREVRVLHDPETGSIAAPAATVETAGSDVKMEKDSAEPKKDFG
ncbi:MAG: mechanosensitive ion channel family protein, partial [Candidatus Binatia bacterium]